MNVTKKEINELKRKVKTLKGYKLNQIEINSFSDISIVYTIYNNYKNDKLTGKQPLISGTIYLK